MGSRKSLLTVVLPRHCSVLDSRNSLVPAVNRTPPSFLAFHLLLETTFFALLSPKYDRRGAPGALPTSATCAHWRYGLIDHRLAPPPIFRLTESTDDLEDPQRCSELALVRAVPSFNPSSPRSTVNVSPPMLCRAVVQVSTNITLLSNTPRTRPA